MTQVNSSELKANTLSEALNSKTKFIEVIQVPSFLMILGPLLFDIARKNNLPLATITIKNVKIAETQGVIKSLTSKVS